MGPESSASGHTTANADEGFDDPDDAVDPSPDGDATGGEVAKLAAGSLRHLLTHKPHNKHCEACESAKMKDVKHFKGAFDRAPAKWGDLLTCDHLDSRADGVAAITGDRQALVVKDVWSKGVTNFSTL